VILYLVQTKTDRLFLIGMHFETDGGLRKMDI